MTEREKGIIKRVGDHLGEATEHFPLWRIVGILQTKCGDYTNKVKLRT